LGKASWISQCIPWSNKSCPGISGQSYQLTEAKGWKSLPAKRDFHGWHGDMWYEQKDDAPIHREIKLAMYVTDVRSVLSTSSRARIKNSIRIV
jgi:hypothetical protein